MSPVDEYARRLAVRQAAAAARERTHIHLGNAKVAIFIGALIYGAVTLGGDPSVMVFAAAGVAYLALAVWHELTVRALTRAQAAVRFYSDGTARIEDRWIGTGATGERFRDGSHPYADDLDVFGSGSLFQLVSGARTPMGEERLAAWLSSGASIAEIRERQSRIAGLRTRIDLRERIAVVNAGARRRIEPAPLIAWAEAAPSLPSGLRPVIVLLALAFGGAVIVMLRGGSGWPIAFLLPIDLALLWWLARRANAIVEGLSSATESAGLDLLSRVICEIEREPFDDAAVVALAARLKGTGDGVAASRGIAKLARVSDWADSRQTCSRGCWRSRRSLQCRSRMRRSRGGHATAARSAIGWMRSVRWKRCCRCPDIRTSIPPIRFPSCWSPATRARCLTARTSRIRCCQVRRRSPIRSRSARRRGS